MENIRRVYGISEPVRRGMELKIVREGEWKPAVLGGGKGNSVHEDILALGGRDTEIGWEDVFQGQFFIFFLIHTFILHLLILNRNLGDEFREPVAFHDEMEQRLKMH